MALVKPYDTLLSMVKTNTNKTTAIITLSPNRSVNWRDVKHWLAFISLPALIIAIGWFVVGVWIIMLFTVLELGLLAYFMYKVCYQNYQVQKITIERNTVIVEAGIHRVKQLLSFSRPGCYLSVKKPARPMEQLELALVGGNQSLAIGDFLNPIDRELARKSLVAAGIVECSSRWWSQ